jgi:hypothetical protein
VQQVARTSECDCGSGSKCKDPGYRFAHPGYARYRPWSLEGHRIDLKTLDDDVHTMDVGLTWKSAARLSTAARAFCEFVALA